MSKSVEIRPVVRAFAEAMELKLRENDHKPGWKGDVPWALLYRLREETDELQGELSSYFMDKETKDRDNPAKILKEAADVANFAMMVADVVGSLKTDK